MTTTRDTSMRLDLAGLTSGPAQVWGGIRLVPLLRAEPVPGLRLHAELYGPGLGVVQVGPRTDYVSYIPHGFVADWGAGSGDPGPSAAYGTQLGGQDQRHGRGRPHGADEPVAYMPLRAHRRMARREAKHRLRFLPLHLALDGYLALHFGGPVIAWEEWSRRAIRSGLSPRAEEAYAGTEVRGLGDALRMFEIHPGQCGVLLYAADALAAAFVVPHPDDYRALHSTMVQDLYGELIHQYALLSAPVPDFVPRLGDDVRSLADLRDAVTQQQRAWADFHDGTMAAGLLDPAYTAQRVYRAGPFTLNRFLPDFRLGEENHIGETITTPDGHLAYLKTFRLSQTQTRRGHLLTRLAAHDWHLPRTAEALHLTEPQLALRLESAGFASLLRQDILDAYRAAARRSG
ncbi:ARPP-2 domain-containing protein [Streptomyces sp. CA-111067]|uniref:ARPP-2 domain-containing protein n=1 Tax=Streptomyces sp. CA-111067 TaxID=3240046 RepID=UPI003D99D00A